MTEPATAGHDYIVPVGTPLHRVHRDRPGAIAWFDTSEHGRFNLTDVTDRGTCYLALDPLGAYIETLGRILTRSRDDINARRHSTVAVDRDLRLFDLTRSEARAAYRSAGLDHTATIRAGDDYEAPQRLARLVHDDDYDGILYTARHDPGHAHRSIALFGRAGPNDTDVVFDSCETDTIGNDLIDAGRATFGIVVLAYPISEHANDEGSSRWRSDAGVG